MTVGEAIAKLSRIEDKSKELAVDFDFGTGEPSDPFAVMKITECPDCVIIH